MEPADGGMDGGSDAKNEPLDFDDTSAFHRSDPVDDLLDLVPDGLDHVGGGFGPFEESSDGSRRGRDGFAAKDVKDAFGTGCPGAVCPGQGFDGRFAHGQAFCGRGARIQSYACILLAAACTFDSDDTGVSEEVAPFGEATI